MLDDDAVRRLIGERDSLTTRLELAPRRLVDAARQLDTVNQRIAVLKPRVTKGTVLLDEARTELAKASGWLNRLPRADRERYEQIVDVLRDRKKTTWTAGAEKVPSTGPDAYRSCK